MTTKKRTRQLSKVEVAGSRRVVGTVEQVQYLVTAEETTFEQVDADVPASEPPSVPVVPPVPTSVSSFLKQDMSTATLLYGHDPVPAGPGPHWYRSLSIDGVDDDRYIVDQPKPTGTRLKHMMNRPEVGIQTVADGVELWTMGKPGQSIGARLQLNPKVYLDDSTPGTLLYARFIYDRPFWDFDWKAGSWHSVMQGKHVDIYGNAAFQMNVELPWYDSKAPQVPRLTWGVNAAQGLKLERETRVPFPEGISTLDLAIDMKPSGGSLLAKLNGMETAYITGRLADDNGDLWLYPALMYGDKFKSGVRNTLKLKSVEFSATPIAA